MGNSRLTSVGVDYVNLNLLVVFLFFKGKRIFNANMSNVNIADIMLDEQSPDSGFNLHRACNKFNPS